MSKHVREKCRKLCISSILSSKRSITPTRIDANWRHSNLVCSTVKQSHMQNSSSMCQSMLEKSVENWRTETRTDGRTDGESDRRRTGRTDGHHHTIIRPIWRLAYKKERRYAPVIIFSFCIPVTLTSDLFTLKANWDIPASCGVCAPSFKIDRCKENTVICWIIFSN